MLCYAVSGSSQSGVRSTSQFIVAADDNSSVWFWLLAEEKKSRRLLKLELWTTKLKVCTKKQDKKLNCDLTEM